MIDRSSGFIRAFLQGVVECVLFFPVLFIPAFYMLPESDRWIWPAVVLGGYLLGYAGSLWLRFDRQFTAILWACLISVAVSIVYAGVDRVLIYLIPVLFMASYRGSRMEQVDWHNMFQGVHFMTGLIVYAVSSFVLRFLDSFQDGAAILTWMGAAALMITLLIVNRQSVLGATLPGNDQPVLERRVLRYNRWFVIILLLLIGIVTLLPQLQQWVSDLVKGIISWIVSLFASGAEQVPDLPPEPEHPPELSLFDEEIKPPRPWMILIEQILIYVVFSAIGIAILYALYRLGKLMPGLYRSFTVWMNRLMNRQQVPSSLGYEDEVEKIERDPASKRFRRLLSRMRGGKSRSGAGPQGMSERIRDIYRAILSRSIREGYPWKAFHTPRETHSEIKKWDGNSDRISASLIKLYEEARYGNRTITQEEVERLQHEHKHT